MDLMTWLRAEWDRVLGFTLIALGAVLLVLGYLGVSDSPYVAEQLSYIVSGGLGGLFLLGAGATLLILADLHDEWRKLDRVEAMLSGEIPFPNRPHTNGVGPAPAAPAPAAAPDKPALASAAPALMVETTIADPDAGPGPRPGPTAAAIFRRERFTLGIGMLLAVAVLFGSWARASGVDEPKPAIAAVAVAVFGLVLVAMGAVGSTLTVKRHVQLRKGRLFAPWLAPEDGPVGVAPVAAGSLVVAPGLTRYHRAECPSVAGLAVRPLDRRSIPAELAPCRLCDADSAG
ncbi:MAG: hypothetical protein QOI86_4544 [Actinomycetota bacterium]|nr:hypothetical protein [Actinomycetota bacterium]